MANANDLLNWARSQIGVTENPPGSNRVRYWDDVKMSGAQGQPWCAAFCLAGLERLGVVPVSRSVYVPQLINVYRRAGLLFSAEKAIPGDQVLYLGSLFPLGHTGIVESVDHGNRTITSIEGNTSAGVTGSQSNGGGVYRRVRSW